MSKVALAIAASLVLFVVAPAFSQPFADVPTDHWAFDAIAELAAKGIVEGYPDGTFKGDRAMTRYEMAMVVARLLARIEAIKVPAPAAPVKIPPAEVGRADIATLQRLINEFRAELAALGVRVTAVEEELAALRARLDNTRVEGFSFFRYQSNIVAPPGTGGGSNYAYGLFNLTFTGNLGQGVSAVVNTLLSNRCDGGVYFFGTGTTGGCVDSFEDPVTGEIIPIPIGAVDSGGYMDQGVTFDRAYLDWAAYGLNWRLGKQTYVLGPIGLLYNEGSIRVYGADSVGADGMKVTGSFGPVNFEAAGFTYLNNPDITGDFSAPGLQATAVLSFLMGRASLAPMAGWTFGASIYSERWNWQGDFVSPGLGNTNSNGWGVDIKGTIFPGLTLTAEYATFTPSAPWAAILGVPAAGQSAWQVNTVWNLAQMTGMTQFSPTLNIYYKNAPRFWSPLATGMQDLFVLGSPTYAQGLQAWGVQLNLTFSPAFRPYVNYETGHVVAFGAGPDGDPATADSVNHSQLELGFRSQVAAGLTARFRYQRRVGNGTTNGTDLFTNRYRLQLDWSW